MTQETTQQPEQPQSPKFGDVVVARAGSYYRNTRYLMAAMCVLGGLWFAYDGWVGWPESTRLHEEAKVKLKEAQDANDSEKIQLYSDQMTENKFHDEHDILLQKRLAFALPPIGVAILAWSLYRSRGAYRLEGKSLSVPGHPTVALDDITKIDKQKWDRKGIVHLNYEKADKKTGVITLDDFIYDRPPTDEIFKRVEDYLLPAASPQQPTA